MGEIERLNSMSRDELLEFARFAYTAYPTLLVTHEKLLACYKSYPKTIEDLDDKNPNRPAEDDRQMSLDLE